MAQTADALHGHGVARPGPARAERVVGRDAGAEERTGVDGRELLRDARRRLVGHDHVFGVPAVVADPGDLRALAVDEEALATRGAHEAVTAVPADPDAVARFPLRHLRADRVDPPRNLVARDARKFEAREPAGPHEPVAVADAASLDLDPDLGGADLRHLALHRLERPACLRCLNGSHLRHDSPPTGGPMPGRVSTLREGGYAARPQHSSHPFRMTRPDMREPAGMAKMGAVRSRS